eukprot:2671443-Prymnesium_polylepis.1
MEPISNGLTSVSPPSSAFAVLLLLLRVAAELFTRFTRFAASFIEINLSASALIFPPSPRVSSSTQSRHPLP